MIGLITPARLGETRPCRRRLAGAGAGFGLAPWQDSHKDETVIGTVTIMGIPCTAQGLAL